MSNNYDSKICNDPNIIANTISQDAGYPAVITEILTPEELKDKIENY